MIFAGDTGGTDTCMTRLLGEASSGTRLRSLLSQPVPCCLDPRCSLSSNVFIEGRNGRVGGHAAHVRHSRGSGNPGEVSRTRSRRLMAGAPELTPDADGQ